MKHSSLVAILGALLLTACTFSVPLSTDHTVPIDPALLGAWQWDHKDGEGSGPAARMMILRFSDTEYLIRHLDDGSEIDFRAYAAEIAGVRFMQLEVLGDDDGPIDLDDRYRFAVVNYELVEGRLVMRALNTDLVSDELDTTEALRAAFEQHKDNPELFVDPDTAHRIESLSS